MQVEARCPLGWALILSLGLEGSTEPCPPECLLCRERGSQALEDSSGWPICSPKGRERVSNSKLSAETAPACLPVAGVLRCLRLAC